MENRNGLVVGAVATRASGHAERLAALTLIEPFADRPQPVTFGADKGYDSGDFVMECREQTVTPHLAQNQSGLPLRPFFRSLLEEDWFLRPAFAVGTALPVP
jgi:hypothetical protein